MSEPHIVTTLRRKRAEIGGYIRDLERQIKRQRAALAHVDATIRLFAPGVNPDTIPPKRTYRRSRYFAKGELSRLCLDALRKAEGAPITAGEIARMAMSDKDLPADEGAVTHMVLTALRRFCKRGTAVREGTSRNARWAIKGGNRD
jgi:hypothetical protein